MRHLPRNDIMVGKNKKRDPMPSPEATPEEIGEFWDTHCLIDYLDETHEVEFEVSIKSEKKSTSDIITTDTAESKCY